MKDKLIPVEDREGLYRDPKSGAIINANETAYAAYKQKKIIADQKRLKELSQEMQINTMKKEIDGLKTEVGSLNEKSDKILQLLEKITNGNS